MLFLDVESLVYLRCAPCVPWPEFSGCCERRLSLAVCSVVGDLLGLSADVLLKTWPQLSTRATEHSLCSRGTSLSRFTQCLSVMKVKVSVPEVPGCSVPLLCGECNPGSRCTAWPCCVMASLFPMHSVSTSSPAKWA